jgi:hypothetical protein
VKRTSKRLEGERAEVMGLSMHSDNSFIFAVGNSVTIHFPRKGYLSLSTTHAIYTWDRGDENFGSLNDFEVRGIL